MFVDAIRVRVRSGNGGKGCVAFLREAFRPRGGPCGGNGGRGGNVILQADNNIGDFTALYHQSHLRARNGAPGSGRDRDGRSAPDLVVGVPCGTLVWQIVEEAQEETVGEEERPLAAPVEPDTGGTEHRPPDLDGVGELQLFGDLSRAGECLMVGRGGRGGLGNKNFATSRKQAPRFAQPGERGTGGAFYLELRTIADIGFLGFPNAGKSTLLAALSQARPRIASYPFTTLRPHIGILEFPDHTRTILCDIPGIIKGASENAGLGLGFLRHLQRCRSLAWLLDMAGADGRKPWEDYRQLREEIRSYDPGMLRRPSVVLANKMDEPGAAANLKRFRKEIGRVRILPISAAFDQGMEAVRKAFRRTARNLSLEAG